MGRIDGIMLVGCKVRNRKEFLLPRLQEELESCEWVGVLFCYGKRGVGGIAALWMVGMIIDTTALRCMESGGLNFGWASAGSFDPSGQ